MRRERRWRFGLSLIVLLLAAAGPAGAAAAAGDTGTLVVTLRDTDGTPLRLADVKVFDADGGSVQHEAFTDDDGRAVFDDVAPGGYTVFFVVEGMRMWAESTEDGDTATVYRVAAGQQAAVTPRLLPHARIAGTLTDTEGGIAWGEMIASPVGTFGARVNEVTDSDGRAAVRVAPGVYRVGFTTDTISQWVPGRPSPHGAREFALAAGDRIAVAESLPETGRVSGTVVDAAGKPVLGATVRLHQGAYETNRERTNRQGEFVLSRVRAGSYTVSVTSPRGSTQWLPGRATAEEAQRVTVGSAAEVTLREALLPTGDIVGTLYGRDGAPTSRGWIFARPVPDPGGEALISATPDREGRYRLAGLAAGRYRIGFEIDGRRQYLGGHGTAAASAPVAVPAGETLTLDERAAPGRPVTLRAVDAGSGRPVREFCALLVGPDDERLPDSDTDKYPHGCTDDATLTLPDVLPGRYEAQLRSPRPSGWLPATAAVDVPATGSAAAQVAFARGGTVHVRVVARGLPASRRAVAATVHLVPDTAGAAVPAPRDTDDKGTATFAGVPDGRYRIFVEPRGDALGRQWVGANRGVGAAHLAASVSVRAGRTTYPPVARLDPAGRITGRVTAAANGRPLMAQVYWLPPQVADAPAAVTDTDGRFTADGFGPYEWPLRFDNGAFPGQWSGQRPDPASAQAVRVPVGGVATLDAALTRGVDVTGVVGGRWRAGTVTAVGPDGAAAARGEADPLTRCYQVPVLPGHPVRLRYEFATPAGPRLGWYDRAASFAAARDVPVPAGGGAVVDIGVDQLTVVPARPWPGWDRAGPGWPDRDRAGPGSPDRDRAGPGSPDRGRAAPAG